MAGCQVYAPPEMVVSDEDLQALAEWEKLTMRQEIINGELLQIPVGAILRFVDDRSTTCSVVKPRQMYVDYQGQVIHLSVDTQQVMQAAFPLASSTHWIYDDGSSPTETLLERKFRMEEAEVANDYA